MSFIYLASLIGTIMCFGLIDWRYKLAIFYNLRRAALTLFAAWLIFLIWDIIGVGLGIFYEGSSSFATGVMLLPHLPLEEPFFLLALVYMSLVLYRLGEETPWRHI